MSSMMHNPFTYLILMTLLIVLTVLPLVVIRSRAALEKRGGDLRDDRHLG
jgi:Tfp pilus assembly protein PilX